MRTTTRWRTGRAGTVLGLALATALGMGACAGDPPPAAAPPARSTAVDAPLADAAPATVAPDAGPSVQEIVDALDAVAPTRHPRDNTANCAAKACLGLITTGAVSVYRWPDAESATRFAGDGGAADRIGPYVLSYRTREQRSTPPEVRAAYRDRVRALVGPLA